MCWFVSQKWNNKSNEHLTLTNDARYTLVIKFLANRVYRWIFFLGVNVFNKLFFSRYPATAAICVGLYLATLAHNSKSKDNTPTSISISVNEIFLPFSPQQVKVVIIVAVKIKISCLKLATTRLVNFLF